MRENSHWALNGESRREPLHYPDCGLDNIYLLSGYELVQTAYGDGVVIKNLDGLRKAIGFQLATRKKLLHGQEIRFLRKEMDITQSELGKCLGVDAQTVARWEKGENHINGSAERLLRLLYVEHADGRISVHDLLCMLDEVDSSMSDKQLFEQTSAGWKSAA
jgi:putative transcriptional regulator